MNCTNSLLQFLSSEDISNTLLFWINCFPFPSCQEVLKLTDLRDAVALSEILVNVDEVFFKDLKISHGVDKNLWLVHLVQLKKLFLKLSAYVELYLKQDWSLLPVPDFKLVAKSDEITSHLNFMVAAVLLTATHSGKNLKYENILEFVVPTGLRKDIQSIQDAFLMALEPKSPKSFQNSPRKSSIIINNNNSVYINNTNNNGSNPPIDYSHLGITPKVLFPSNLSTSTTLSIERTIEEFQEFDIKLQEIQGNTLENKEELEEAVPDMEPPTVETSTNDYGHNNLHDSEFINLQNEIKLLEIKLSEMEKLLEKSKESENSQAKTIENLSKTQRELSETFEELCQLKEKQEFEKLERNSLMAAFDHERQCLDEQVELLLKEKSDNFVKIEELLNEKKHLSETLRERDERIEAMRGEDEILKEELNQSNVDNSKLVKALKKARDHIINQDSLIKELKGTLELSELRRHELLTSKDEESKFLKQSFETERIAMNRVLIDLGAKIQKSNL